MAKQAKEKPKKLHVEVTVSAKQEEDPKDEQAQGQEGQAERLQEVDPEAATGVVDADTIIKDFGKTTSERDYKEALDRQLDQDEAVFMDGYKAFCRAGGPDMKLSPESQQKSPEEPETPEEDTQDTQPEAKETAKP